MAIEKQSRIYVMLSITGMSRIGRGKKRSYKANFNQTFHLMFGLTGLT